MLFLFVKETVPDKSKKIEVPIKTNNTHNFTPTFISLIQNHQNVRVEVNKPLSNYNYVEYCLADKFFKKTEIYISVDKIFIFIGTLFRMNGL